MNSIDVTIRGLVSDRDLGDTSTWNARKWQDAFMQTDGWQLNVNGLAVATQNPIDGTWDYPEIPGPIIQDWP